MGTRPSSRMDERRLELFERALDEVTGGRIAQATWESTLCADLDLDEECAIDVIGHFFTFFDDMMFLVRNGFVQAAPDEDDPEVMRELIEMSQSGLIECDPHEVCEDDDPDESEVAQIPICKEGVAYLEVAIHAGMYVEFFITTRTTVGDVIAFIKEVELMELPPRLISHRSIDLASAA